MTRHVVMFSGGIGSWSAAKRVAAQYGTDSLTLLFTDTLIEDQDLYRFLVEAAANVGGELVRIADGRDPWQVYYDERVLGSTRADPCSKILKRHISDRWLTEHCDPANTTVYVGIDWSEAHRFERLRNRRFTLGWRYEAPMCVAPYVTKQEMFAALQVEGIAPPRLYAMGFSHNNCGGFCCKAGIGHFANLLRTLPERYAYHEAKEAEYREARGWRQTILRDFSDGKAKPITMRALRERIEAGGQVDMFEQGGCGCFSD